MHPARLTLGISRECFFGSLAGCLPAVIILAAFGINAYALDARRPLSGYIRTQFTVEDGLSSNRAYAVLQTRDGFLWIGTSESLLRFDGRHFSTVDFLPPAMQGVSVSALAEAPDGALWVGTSAGLARIPAKALQQIGRVAARFYYLDSQYSDSVQCFHFSANGTLWVGTGAGLYRLNGDKFSAVIPKLWVSRVEEAKNGHLLVITSRGFVEWDGERVIDHPDLPARLGVAYNGIFHVLEDHRGVKWYCTSSGVAREINGSLERLQPYAQGTVAFRAYEDATGTIWIAENIGLARVGVQGVEMIMPDVHARHLTFDHDGNLWVGTNGTGLVRFKDRVVTMFTSADGLPKSVPMAMLAASDGKLWVGSNCGGVSWFDGTRFHNLSDKDGLANSCVFSLAEDSQKNIWVGTWAGGLFRYRDGRFAQILGGDTQRERVVLSIVSARDGSLWIGYSDGLSQMGGEGQIRNFTIADGLSSNRVLAAYEDRRGTIWVQTSKGIDRLVGSRFNAVAAEQNAVFQDARLGFGEDESEEVFAFALRGGTFHVQGNRLVRVAGIPGITGMTKSAQDLWFCGKGIYRAPLGSLRRWATERDEPPDYALFGRADGMISAECSGGFPNMAVTQDGKLWVATDQGVAMIDPAEVHPQFAKPVIYVEKIVIDKRTVASGPELSVPPGTHHVELHFGAIELQSPERIRLQYRLDGVDRDWLDAGETATAIYTGLPLGMHSFHVRASNRDGIWDRSGITYNVIQKPYYYETRLFEFALACIFLGLLTIAYRSRVRGLAEQMRDQFRVRTLERERIARELHDTLLQGYLSASFQAQAALGRLEEESAARQPLSRAIELMAQASRESRMVLKELRSAEIDAWTLEHALAHIPIELALSSDIHLVVRAKGKPRALRSALRDEVFRIGREAIVNAYTHSEATDIDVETEYGENTFRLVVQDNGCGIGARLLEAGREGHWGMQGMKERSESIGARLDMRSRPGAGTEIVLSLPFRVAFDQNRTKQSRWFNHLRRLLMS